MICHLVAKNKTLHFLFLFGVVLMVWFPIGAKAELVQKDDVKLNLSDNHDNWFFIEPPVGGVWDVYGLSMLINGDNFQFKNAIVIKIYQVLDSNINTHNLSLKKLRTVISYPRDINRKKYYTVFFRPKGEDKARNRYESIAVGPKDRFMASITTKESISIYLATEAKSKFTLRFIEDKRENKNEGETPTLNQVKNISNDTKQEVMVHNDAYLRWVGVQAWGVFAGSVLSDTEKPYHVLLPLVYLLLFTSIWIIVLGMVFFGRNLFGNRETLAVLGVISVACLASVLLYFATVSTDFIGGDNWEMQRAQYLYTDVHFPGYPLMLFLGYWFGKLMPVGNFLYKANLFAAFCSSLGIGFFAGATYLLTKHKTSAVLISLVMATTQTIWNYSVVAQNYSVSILFQCLLLFAIVNLQKYPTYPSFFKLIIFAFLAPIAHMTNAPGALVIMLLATIWYWRTHRFQLFKITKIILSLGVIVVILYSPLLLMESPLNYPPVISKSADHNLLTFNKKNFYTFLSFITGDSGGKQRRSGIINVVKTRGIFVILRNQSLGYLKLLGYGYGYLFAVMGGMGLIFLLIYKKKELITWYVAFTLIGNYIFSCSELVYYSPHPEDYVLTTHQFPSIVMLSFAMVGIILFTTKKNKECEHSNAKD